MLSSSVVTVLAPHWSSRLRRSKRFEGTGNSESQGNLQDVTSTVTNHTHRETQIQHGPVRVLADGSQPQVRAPFVGSRRNVMDWSTMSDPVRMDYDSNKKMNQTVSLDVTSGRTDNRKLITGALSPIATNTPPLSPPSFDPNEQRRNPQTGHKGPLSPISSKPTTSSLLLSLRRINSSGRSSNAPPTFPGENPAPSDQEGNSFNNNEQQRSTPVRSPLSISYRSTEIRPVLSPSPFDHRERSVSEPRFFSTSPLKKDTPFTQQPQTCSKQAFLSNVPSARQQICRSSNKNPNLFPKSSVPSPRHSPYDPSALLKTHPLPRRTTLTSTSWWKQVTQEGSSPLSPDDTTNIKDQPNTPLVPPCDDSSALAVPTLTDSKRFSSQIPNNRNNNSTESVFKGNMNLIMTQGGTHNLKQIKDSPEYKSDRLFRRQYASSLNNREPLKPLNLPDVLSRSHINRAAAQTTLSHPKDLSKSPVSNSSFTANITELSPTLINLKSSDSPTERSSKYKNDQVSSTPTSLHNKDSEKLTKHSLNLSSTIPLNSQAPASKTTSDLPPTSNTKTDSSFYFHPLHSQTNIHTSNTDSSSQTSKLTDKANVTPLGFKRSYVSIPTHVHPKAVSSLIHTVSASPQLNNIPVSSASITSTTTASHPAVTTAPGPSFLTPAIKLSPTTTTLSPLLTPPATPNNTSPSYLDTSNPKESRTFSSSLERDKKKLGQEVKGKRVRRVTWEDSLDHPCSEPTTVEKPDPSGVSTSPLSPCVRAPPIFSFLRSSSPTINTSPLCPTTSQTPSIQMGKGGRYRCLSSDFADLTSTEQEMSKRGANETLISDPLRQELTTTGQERTQSIESGKVQCRSSAALSLPPDFSSGYKLRYSSPPYSTLMSSRSTQGELKTIKPRSPLFQQASHSVYTPLSLHTEPGSGIAIPTSKSPLAPVSPPQTFSFPVKNKIATKESSHEVSETYQINNQSQYSNHDTQNGQLLLVNNRVHISSPCEKAQISTCVTETLVYSIKSKTNTATTSSKNTTPKPLQHTEAKLSQPHRGKNKEATGEPHSHSGQSSSSGSSADSQSQCDGSHNRKTKENVLGKSRFFSVESSNEQSPKKSRFALKKSVSTPNSSLSRSESERSNKTNNKMDQVLNKIKQTFSTRRSDDDPSFPWKWKKASQTPSISGSSDISTVSDITSDRTKMVKEREKEGFVIKDSDQGTEGAKRQTQNRYIIIPPPAAGFTSAGDQFSIWSEKSNQETDQDEQNACARLSDNKTQVHLMPHTPKIHNFDKTDYKPTIQLPTCRDLSPGRSPNPSGSYPTQFRKSTSSSRSPFSPFPSLTPVSPFSSPDITDDNVFYSPKLQRCKSSSPCEPEEGISLGGSRRSRASTGPPSASPGQDSDHFASSYADLKYGIEPGRSFSVSSVLSSRPSGPGRISTGSRFMSVGDLSVSSLTCGGNDKDSDQWSFTPDWTTEYDCMPPGEYSGSHFPSEPGKMRSRSLPRSLTRRLGNWSSGVSVSQHGNATGSKQANRWSPNMNICQFEWDTEGPPTPPPTPPLSPVCRRMSQPPSISSPTFPSPPGAPLSVESQSSRGHLPSRGYVSSLSTFEESSDSSSDTTTDDEYYLETGDGEEKETEL
nr:PREDICTED: mucin-17-like [Paralichthys olivaceus]